MGSSKGVFFGRYQGEITLIVFFFFLSVFCSSFAHLFLLSFSPIMSAFFFSSFFAFDFSSSFRNDTFFAVFYFL